jgi:predicted site-specific integrase-resolvase
MKNKRSLRPKEAAEESDVSIRTLIRWDEAGKLRTVRTVRTVRNQRRISREEICRLRRQGENHLVQCALYARVSRARLRAGGNLARQTERLKETASERDYGVVQVSTEQASSLSQVPPYESGSLCGWFARGLNLTRLSQGTSVLAGYVRGKC